jgi:hypothetical protein
MELLGLTGLLELLVLRVLQAIQVGLLVLRGQLAPQAMLARLDPLVYRDPQETLGLQEKLVQQGLRVLKALVVLTELWDQPELLE